MKKVGIFISLLVVLIACKKVKLDGLAFPAVQLDSYEFGDYEGNELDIPDSMHNANITESLVTMESIDQETGESYTIYGFYMGDTATISTDTVIFYCHGQSLHNDVYWTRQNLLAHLDGLHNYGVLMIDYRGYGMSEGSPTEQGLIEDADAGIDWLIEKGLTGDRCVYYGFSLGCIPLINRAGNRTDFVPSRLICESPLASVENLAQSSTLLNVDKDFVTELNFENAEEIKKVDVPYMWLHGVLDDYIEIENGELIYANYAGIYKEAHRIQTANHGDIPLMMGYTEYLSAVLNFIQKP